MREARFGIDFHLESDAKRQCLSDTAVSGWRDSVIREHIYIDCIGSK